MAFFLVWWCVIAYVIAVADVSAHLCDGVSRDSVSALASDYEVKTNTSACCLCSDVSGNPKLDFLALTRESSFFVSC